MCRCVGPAGSVRSTRVWKSRPVLQLLCVAHEGQWHWSSVAAHVAGIVACCSLVARVITVIEFANASEYVIETEIVTYFVHGRCGARRRDQIIEHRKSVQLGHPREKAIPAHILNLHLTH
jgi:hypothetical protein